MKGRKYDYRCTRCGVKPGAGSDMEARDLLTVKQVQFRAMGDGQGPKKSTNVAWLCRDCLLTDEHYFHDWVAPTRPTTLEEDLDAKWRMKD